MIYASDAHGFIKTVKLAQARTEDKEEDEDEDNRPKGKKERKHGNEDDTETTMIELQHTQKNEREIRQSIAERVVSNTFVYISLWLLQFNNNIEDRESSFLVICSFLVLWYCGKR